MLLSYFILIKKKKKKSNPGNEAYFLFLTNETTWNLNIFRLLVQSSPKLYIYIYIRKSRQQRIIKSRNLKASMERLIIKWIMSWSKNFIKFYWSTARTRKIKFLTIYLTCNKERISYKFRMNQQERRYIIRQH